MLILAFIRWLTWTGRDLVESLDVELDVELDPKTLPAQRWPGGGREPVNGGPPASI